MVDVTAPQFQQDVNNTADWANGDENKTVTMRLGQQADSPAKVIKDIKDAGSEAAGSIQFTVKGAFADGFNIDYYFELGETATGDIYRYKRPNALPFVVPAGFDPTVDSRFEQWVNTDHNNLTSRNAVGAHEADAITFSQYQSVKNVLAHHVNPLDYGAESENPLFDSTTAMQQAYEAAKTTKADLLITGELYGNFTFDGDVIVRGLGKKASILRPFNNSLPCVTVGGTGTASLESSLQDLTIDGVSGAGQLGLILGSATLGYSNGSLRRLDIKGFVRNWEIYTATNCTFEQVYSYSATGEAFFVASERNFQLCTFTNCRMRISRIGGQIQSGNRLTFIGTNFESNTDTGLILLRTNTSGPSHINFIGCWLENNGGNPVSATGANVTSLRLDMLSTIQTTSTHNINFTCCNVTGATNGISGATNTAYDVTAARAKNVVFDKTSFSPEFDSTRFAFSGTGQVFIEMNDCGTLNEAPTPAMYSNFPAMSTTSQESASLSATQGFAYTFKYQGYEYSNKKKYTISGSPLGVLVPFKQGMKVFDSTNLVWYESTGNTQNDQWLRTSQPYNSNYPTSDLNNIASTANIRDKYAGRQVWDTTVGRPVYAVGSSASSLWVYSDGTTAATPV